MKNKIFRSITLVLGVIMLIALAETGSAAAASVSLSNITVPAGGARNSRTFRVRDRGWFTVRVRVRTNTILGYGGQSTYRVRLKRGNTVLATRTLRVGSSFRTTSIRHNVARCAQTQHAYHIEVRNISTDNPQQGIAAFPTFTVPSLDPASGTLSQFGVTQGNTVNRSIPNNLEPSGTGGRLRITATWDSPAICSPNPLNLAGCRLTFRLRRDGSIVASSNGYAHNALFGNANPKMTINHNVSANQVSGNWTLQIVGSSGGDVSNVRPNVRFTPRCQD